MKVLILGGTTEARELAAACAGRADITTVSSLAGRTHDPRRPTGEIRVGGFGGVDGLAEFLRTAGVDAVVDATHPFADTMTRHAIAAAGSVGTPLLVLRRPGWTETAGDRWRRVASLAAAAELVPSLGSRVFLTTGRQSIGEFARVAGCWFLSRSVEPPSPPMPAELSVLLDRGPFTLSGERELMARHRIEVLVSKDSGGTAPKLVAARERGIPVVLVDRPPAPDAPTVESTAEALAWVAELPR